MALMRKAAARFWRAWQIDRAHPSLKMHPPILWDFDDISAIQIGKEVHIGAFGELAVFAKSAFSPIAGSLHIGHRTQIGSSCNIRACGGQIEIGKNCLIAQHVSLIAANHAFQAGAIYRDLPWNSNRHGITLGDNVWLGAGVIVLPGCRIGENAIVAAGSVVTKNIPPNEIWGNIPARFMKRINNANKTKS